MKTIINSRQKLIQWEILFSLINTLLIIIISQRYTSSMELPASGLGWFYFINLTFGHFTFLIFFLVGIVLLPLAYLFPYRKFIIPFNIVVMSSIITLLTIDTFVFDQYRFHISPFFIQMMLDAGGQIIGFSTLMWLILLSSFLLIILTEFFIASLVWKYQIRIRQILKPRLSIGIMITMYFMSHIIHIVADAQYDRSVTRLTQYYPLLNAATAKSFMIKQGWAKTATPAESAKINNNGMLNYPLSEVSYNNNNKPLNLLFIVLDSWRFDAMSAAITPNIYQMSHKSLNFTNHYSGANDTRSGIFSMFYGLPGNYWHAFESNQLGPVLIDTLLENKYQTGIFASAPLINPEFDRTVFTQIPDLQTSVTGNTAYKRDEKIVEKWLKLTEQYISQDQHQPLFGFLFFDSIHAYQYPDDYPRNFTPALDAINYFTLSNNTDTLPIKNLYKNTTHYVDSLVGKVFADLKQKKLLKNTVIIITGDHGQEINDNKLNYWGHNSNFTKYQTKVPLIVHWPGKAANTIDQLTSHYDLVPTLMKNLLHVSTDPKTYSIGRDLFSTDLKPLDAVIMTNYSMISVFDINQNIMMVKNRTGSVDYYDQHYRPVTDKLSAPIISQAIKDMSRFYK